VRDASMLFVDGSITSLSGPGEGVPAIQNNTTLTITATDNVTITAIGYERGRGRKKNAGALR
jgi:hypothetical protein